MVGCCGWSTVTYIHQLPMIVEEYTPSISCMLVVHVKVCFCLTKETRATDQTNRPVCTLHLANFLWGLYCALLVQRIDFAQLVQRSDFSLTQLHYTQQDSSLYIQIYKHVYSMQQHKNVNSNGKQHGKTIVQHTSGTIASPPPLIQESLSLGCHSNSLQDSQNMVSIPL